MLDGHKNRNFRVKLDFQPKKNVIPGASKQHSKSVENGAFLLVAYTDHTYQANQFTVMTQLG